ncbi:MAG: hypothetical protein PHC90_00665 [Syntrophorhabdaceae bacterium]|nr:hypothetical protein [Syntrophorhabdaceae bacterium]
MKKILTDDQGARLDELTAQAEKRSKAQIVLAVIERSDSYAELPRKAFAPGAPGSWQSDGCPSDRSGNFSW